MKILIVEDSVTVAAFVRGILSDAPNIHVLPVASDAAAGVRAVQSYRPDVVLMDVVLPDHDGVWAIEEIMADAPCPIVVLSGHLSSTERDITYEALRAGAVDVMPKPTSLDRVSHQAFGKNLVSMVRLMSAAKVVRRSRPVRPFEAEPVLRNVSLPQWLDARPDVLLVGASTGGPPQLFRLLSALPTPYPLPIVIVQHTLRGFDGTLAGWLGQSGQHVHVAHVGVRPEPGKVLLAPSDQFLRWSADGQSRGSPGKLGPNFGSAVLESYDADGGLHCIDETFVSAAQVWGPTCLAILLSGMGEDGAKGLAALRAAGARTIVQHPDTCVVPSMPLSAIALRAVDEQLTPDEITVWLLALADASMTKGSSTPQKGLHREG